MSFRLHAVVQVQSVLAGNSAGPDACLGREMRSLQPFSLCISA